LGFTSNYVHLLTGFLAVAGANQLQGVILAVFESRARLGETGLVNKYHFWYNR
jgi:hypothetical protein